MLTLLYETKTKNYFMKKFSAFCSLIFLLNFASKAQDQPNGTLDDIKEFCTRYTVPFVMPDGVKLYTDVYLPRLRDSLRVSLGDIDLFGTIIHTDTVTFIPYGTQMIAYDSVGLGANKVVNPDPYQLPTIFTRTPYDKGDFDQVGAILAILAGPPR